MSEPRLVPRRAVVLLLGKVGRGFWSKALLSRDALVRYTALNLLLISLEQLVSHRDEMSATEVAEVCSDPFHLPLPSPPLATSNHPLSYISNQRQPPPSLRPLVPLSPSLPLLRPNLSFLCVLLAGATPPARRAGASQSEAPTGSFWPPGRLPDARPAAPRSSPHQTACTSGRPKPRILALHACNSCHVPCTTSMA